jgi:iron complex outermembrane receptor protein
MGCRTTIIAALWLSCGAATVATAQQSGAQPGTTQQSVAPAQTAPANELTEIVITAARKRGEDVQNTPIAITAIDQSSMERNHVVRLDDLPALAPNLQISAVVGTGGAVVVYLRGFGSTASDPSTEPHVATFIDGIYQPATAGSMIDLFDIGQVEVDAGPQGTLAGKNAPVGAIYLTTAPPQDTFGGEVEADYGSYDRTGLRGKIYGPLLQNADGGAMLTGKASFAFKDGGDWIYNDYDHKRDFGGENAKVGRLSLSFTPTENFKWDVVATLDAETDSQEGQRGVGWYGGVLGTSSTVQQLPPLECMFFPGGACPHTRYGATDSNWTVPARFDMTEVSSTMSYRFSPFTITSVSGYVKFWELDNVNDTGTTFSVLNSYDNRTDYDQESQELRISSNKGGGWTLNDRLDWLLGGYASNFSYSFSNNLGVLNGSPAAPNVGPQYADIHHDERGITQSYAAFLHVIYNLTDEWTGTFGVRRSWDYKTHAYSADGTTSYVADVPVLFNDTTVEVGTAYQFDASHMAYVRFSQGYQAGGYAGFATGNTYQPEYNNAYEFGLKGDYLDKHLRVNLAFFLNQLTNLQVGSALPSPNPPGFIQETLNAGAATTQGIEMQTVHVLTDKLTTYLNVGYLQTKYQKYLGTVCSNTGLPTDCSGIPFAYSPKWTVNLGGDYVSDLPQDYTATFSAHVSYKSGMYPIDPPFPSSFQPGYALVNAGVTFRDPSKKYSLELYGTNIFNKHYTVTFFDPGGVSEFLLDGRPAEWGIRARAKF